MGWFLVLLTPGRWWSGPPLVWTTTGIPGVWGTTTGIRGVWGTRATPARATAAWMALTTMVVRTTTPTLCCPAVAGGARGLTPSERRSNYVQVQLGFLGLLQDPLKQSETSPAARAQLDMTEAFMEGGYTGSAGEAKLLSFMKHHGAASADMVSAYKNKKNLRGLVSGRLIPVSVALVGGGVFTWLIQDIVSIAARQLVDAVLMGDRGCRTEACASTVGGETFFTDFMDARQAACMQEDFANEAGSESVEEDGAQRTPRRRLLVPFGLYLDGSALDSNGNAVALPLVFINQFFSAKMHVDHPGLAEVIACVLCSMVASRRFA